MVGDGGDPFQTPGSWEASSPGAGMTGVTCITQLPGGDPWAAIAGHLGLKDSVLKCESVHIPTDHPNDA